MTEFEKIYAEYFPDVYKYVLSLCHHEAMAEDITQETFLKAIKNIHRFKGDCKLRVWLCHIAKNTYFTSYKKSKRTEQLPEEIAMESFESKLIHKEKAFEIAKNFFGDEIRYFGKISEREAEFYGYDTY